MSSKSITIVSIYPERGTSHPEAGGVASYTHNLCSALRDQGEEVTVVCDVPGGKKENYIENGITVERVFAKNLSFFRDIIRKVRQINSPAVHFQQELNLYGGILSAFLLPVAIAFSGKRRKVITLHGVVSREQVTSDFVRENNSSLPPFVVRTAFTILYRLLAASVDGIIVHEAPFKKRLVDEYGVRPEKIDVTPHGVELLDKTDQAAARRTVKVPRNAQVLLFVGYLTGYKGIDLLIEGYKAYLEAHPGTKTVLIIGAGKHPKLKDDPAYLKNSYERLKRKAADMLPSESYRWDGFIPEDKLQAYFSAANLSVYPYTVAMSSSGPMAMSIAYQVPFIGSDVFDEFFDYDGHFFARNPRGFSDVLARTLEDGESNDLIGRLRNERAWPAVARRHIAFYESEPA